MNDIKRYDISYSERYGFDKEEDPNGEYVEWEDHAAAIAAKDARIAELVEENNRLRARIANELCPRIPAIPSEDGGEAPEVVGYGMPNTSIGRSPRMMMLEVDIPSEDQYGGAMWEPLMTVAQHERIVGAYRVALIQARSETPVMIDAQPTRQVGDEREIISGTIGFEFADGELQTVNAEDLLRLAAAFRAALAPAAKEDE